MNDLKVNNSIKMADENSFEQEIMDKLDKLLSGLEAKLVLNVLASYMAKSIIELNEYNKRKTWAFIQKFTLGMTKIANLEIDRRAGMQ